jgi:fibronectin-binding autotransporter adhesin
MMSKTIVRGLLAAALTVGTGGTLVFDPSWAASPVSASAASVPEPATLDLLAVAALVTLAACRRRRNTRPIECAFLSCCWPRLHTRRQRAGCDGDTLKSGRAKAFFRSLPTGFASIGAGVALVLCGPSAHAVNSTWDGAYDFWSNVAHWNTPYFPNNGNGGFTYVANIGSGTVTLDTNVTLNGLNLTGGILGGSKDLTVTSFLLNGGVLDTTGAFNSTTVTLSTGELGRSLTLPAGASTLGGISVDAGYTLTNPSGGTLTAAAPGPGEVQSAGPGSFDNEGTLIKTGAVRYYLSMPYVNNGLIQARSNNLRLDGTGVNNGQADVWPGAQLEITQTTSFTPGSSITGAGTLVLLGGRTTIDGTLSVKTLRLDGSTLAGSGSLSPTNVTLNSGELARNLVLPVGGINTLEGIVIDAGYTLTNPTGGTLTGATGPGEVQPSGSGFFDNEGTLIKTGALRYYLSIPYVNNGLIEVQANNLRLDGVGVSNGRADVQAGAQLETDKATTFSPGSSITGGGTMRLVADTTTINGSLTVSTLQLDGGVLAGSGSLSPRNVILNSGHLARNLVLPVGGINTLEGIVIDAGYTLTNPTGGTLTGATGPGEVQSAGSGFFDNEGTLIKTGALRYYLSIPYVNNGLIEVQANNLRLDGNGVSNGRVDMQAGAQLEISKTTTFSPGSSITGAGSLLVVASGSVTIAGDDTHTGGTSINGGTLALNSTKALGTGPLTINGGTIANTSSAAITLANNNPQTWNANFNFGGTQDLNLGSGPVTLSGSRTVTVQAKTLTIGGNISGNFSLAKAGSGTLILSGTDTYTGATTVSGGTLLATSAYALPSGTSLTVGAGATSIFGSSLVSAPPPASGGTGAVPEPSSPALLAVAALVAFAARRRRRN